MIKRILAVSYTALIICANVLAQSPSTADSGTEVFRKAVRLYEHGMYNQARELFSTLSQDDVVSRGYEVLCCVRMRSADYEEQMSRYFRDCPYSGIVPRIKYMHALNLFDAAKFTEASQCLYDISPADLTSDDLPEYTYKKAYCDFHTGSNDLGMSGFQKVVRMKRNDYQAPAAYSVGYLHYEKQRFDDALEWFQKAGKDPRFAEITAYYIMECRFMKKDYKFVTGNAERMYATVPQERRAHLARIISESYLVLGDTEKAKEYFDKAGLDFGKDRKDYFYAGSLLYAVEDYKGAIENYSRMQDRSDSLGQVANYQLAYSYIQTKNKVSAMQAFRDASMSEYDPDIQEDAFFNYAKLAFDLNNDASVFDSYLVKYSDKKRGERIYSYIALAALYNHDYAGAVEAYDKIEYLDKDMRLNYMKANYLRAEQLVSSSSYRSAVPYLKAASYYAEKTSPLSQLSRYWLAESYYRDDDYTSAAELFKTLYNVSALDGKPEGSRLAYDIAYCYYRMEDYASAVKWFDTYIESGASAYRRDAYIRNGDCFFIRKDYKTSVKHYEAAIKNSTATDGLYPYYQAGLSYSLTGDSRAQVKLLSPALDISPDVDFWCETVYELGRAYTLLGDNDNATECYKKISGVGKDSTYRARALIGLGMISANKSQYDEALSYYKQVVDKMPASEYSKDALRAIESIYQTRQEPDKYYEYLKTLSGADGVVEGDRETLFFNAAEQIFLAENYQKAVVSLQAYLDEYPQGKNVNLVTFYMAESYKNLGKKEQACDWYRKVIDSGEGSFVELSSLNFANLSFGMERYEDAYSGYRSLLENAKISNNKYVAIVGMMNSAYAAKDYPSAISSAEDVIADKTDDPDGKRRARYVRAKSYLATSNRDKAFEILGSLSSESLTPEGAEASFLLIQDSFDKGDFEDVETRVYKFAESGTNQTYWLAKAFILLGDSFAERGDLRQAKATFESIRDGYTPQTKDDDVLSNVNMRLDKIDSVQQ